MEYGHLCIFEREPIWEYRDNLWPLLIIKGIEMRWDRDTGPRYVAINNEVINIHVVTTALHKMNKKLYFSPS